MKNYIADKAVKVGFVFFFFFCCQIIKEQPGNSQANGGWLRKWQDAKCTKQCNGIYEMRWAHASTQRRIDGTAVRKFHMPTFLQQRNRKLWCFRVGLFY